MEIMTFSVSSGQPYISVEVWEVKNFGAESFDIWISMIVLQQNLETAFFWEGGGSGGVCLGE